MKKNRKVPQRIIPLRDFEFLCNDYSAAFLDFSHFKCKNFSFQVQSNNSEKNYLQCVSKIKHHFPYRFNKIGVEFIKTYIKMIYTPWQIFL